MVDVMPAIGPLREHGEARCELTAARAECQRLKQELRTVLSQVQSDTLELLEQCVKQLAQSSSPVDSYLKQYDLPTRSELNTVHCNCARKLQRWSRSRR